MKILASMAGQKGAIAVSYDDYIAIIDVLTLLLDNGESGDITIGAICKFFFISYRSLFNVRKCLSSIFSLKFVRVYLKIKLLRFYKSIKSRKVYDDDNSEKNPLSFGVLVECNNLLDFIGFRYIFLTNIPYKR